MVKTEDVVGSNYTGDEVVPFLIEVELEEPTSTSFLRVRETLQRIGIPSRREDNVNTLYQTAHILSKKGRYYICHFKHMFILDGKRNGLTYEDVRRMNLIAMLLEDWGLVKIKNIEAVDNEADISSVKILSYEEASNWNLEMKYNVGLKVKKNKEEV